MVLGSMLGGAPAGPVSYQNWTGPDGRHYMMYYDPAQHMNVVWGKPSLGGSYSNDTLAHAPGPNIPENNLTVGGQTFADAAAANPSALSPTLAGAYAAWGNAGGAYGPGEGTGTAPATGSPPGLTWQTSNAPPPPPPAAAAAVRAAAAPASGATTNPFAVGSVSGSSAAAPGPGPGPMATQAPPPYRPAFAPQHGGGGRPRGAGGLARGALGGAVGAARRTPFGR